MRLMNVWEIAEGVRCDVWRELATHCDSEMPDFLFLCHFHVLE
jgi:hypothetical protein